MTQREFILIYVGVPLAVALGWLLWRARYFLRNALLYALAVAALIAVIRLSDAVRGQWVRTFTPDPAAAEAAACAGGALDGRAPQMRDAKNGCWT